MFNNKLLAGIILTIIGTNIAAAEQVPISGTVQSRCIIQNDTSGVYSNPTAYTLTTDPTQGGQLAITRVDTTLAGAYYVEITAPEDFSTSPSLPDVVTWVGDTEVQAVSDATNMGTYEQDKIQFGLTDKYDLTSTGSVWFKTSSEATLGGSKAFPGGDYTAMVNVECIAK